MHRRHWRERQAGRCPNWPGHSNNVKNLVCEWMTTGWVTKAGLVRIEGRDSRGFLPLISKFRAVSYFLTFLHTKRIQTTGSQN